MKLTINYLLINGLQAAIAFFLETLTRHERVQNSNHFYEVIFFLFLTKSVCKIRRL
jgi:hypothetical protein